MAERRAGAGLQDIEASIPVAGQEYLDPAPRAVAPCCVCRPQHGVDVFASPRFRAVVDGIEKVLSPFEECGKGL